ncbi:MAG: hypothetical protein ABFR19_02235 [Pseudomonadota bacterium]
MRTLFIVCLSFFFSTQTHAGEWIVDDDSDCKIWSPDPIGPKETITFTSRCVDGKAQGKGTLTVYADGKKSRYYEGEFENGKWQRGKGSVTTYSSGEIVSYHKGELQSRAFPEDRSSGRVGDHYSDSNLVSTPFQQAM